MKRKQFAFEKLEVWQDARKFVVDVHRRTKSYPKEETYRLASQLNRAALSVANNLAEGTSRAGLKDQAHFSNLAYGSLMETASDLIISKDLGLIATEQTDTHY